MNFTSRRIGSLSMTELRSLQQQKIMQFEEAHQTGVNAEEIDRLKFTIDQIDNEIKRRKPVVSRLQHSRKLSVIVGPYPITFREGFFTMTDMTFKTHRFDKLKKAIEFLYGGTYA